MEIKTIEWLNSNYVKFVDQTKLPVKLDYLTCCSKEEVFDAIKRLVVRGAPAIGIAGAYGICVDAFKNQNLSLLELKQNVKQTGSYLKSSRPTAVNLFWAIDKMIDVSENFSGNEKNIFLDCLLKEAKSIHQEDFDMCANIGKHGSSLIKNGMKILTHCNAGSLATGGLGTALAVFYTAFNQNKTFSVYADETRPLLQGSRLTAFELDQNGIDVTVICDNMAGFLMKQGKIDLIITGADRIALNGDAANKIGTYSIAKLASNFNIPFYIAAPFSTFDKNAQSEKDIPIEMRKPDEIINGFNKQTAPSNVKVYNPAFDVTEAKLINGFITEKGIIPPPFDKNIKNFLF